LLEDGIAFPRQIAEAEVERGRGGDELRVELSVEAHALQVRPAGERDDVARLKQTGGGGVAQPGQQYQQAGQRAGAWVHRGKLTHITRAASTRITAGPGPARCPRRPLPTRQLGTREGGGFTGSGCRGGW
jgi:hypothetical protein